MKRPPVWFILTVIAAAVPMVLLTARADSVLRLAYDTDTPVMSWLYPVYIILAGGLACLCYRQRQIVAWILVALMVLTDILLILA